MRYLDIMGAYRYRLCTRIIIFWLAVLLGQVDLVELRLVLSQFIFNLGDLGDLVIDGRDQDSDDFFDWKVLIKPDFEFDRLQTQLLKHLIVIVDLLFGIGE